MYLNILAGYYYNCINFKILGYDLLMIDQLDNLIMII